MVILAVSCTISTAQEAVNFEGKWAYTVANTPYGNFYGTIFLNKKGESYDGKIVNKKGVKYTLEVVRVKGNRLVFTSNVEETSSTFSCYIKGDSLLANVEVKGDKFLYKLKSKKNLIK